jgi:bleomycin hydrolase
MLRIKMIQKYNLPPDFEFSNTFLYFYDKLEKSNYFFYLIQKFKAEPENSRMNYTLLSTPISDGGNWNMILNLVNKYGLIPRNVFNESYNTENSMFLEDFLSNKLRDYAFGLRKITGAKKENEFIRKCLEEVYKILVIFLGEPPKKFDWEYMSNGRFKIVKNITPNEFYTKYLPVNLNDYILLANNPIQPFNKNFTVDNFNNMVNGQEINYVNVSNDIIVEGIKKSLDKEDPLWFGCDVGLYLDKHHGILDIDTLNYRSVFATDIQLNKENRLLYRTSDVTHAMIFRGYDNKTNQPNCNGTGAKPLSKSKPKPKLNTKKRSTRSKTTSTRSKIKVSKKYTKSKKKLSGGGLCNCKNKVSQNPITKFLVENSWGKGHIDENLIMTTSYFEEFHYIVAVHKKYLPRKVIQIGNQNPKRLNLWDPFGYLLF